MRVLEYWGVECRYVNVGEERRRGRSHSSRFELIKLERRKRRKKEEKTKKRKRLDVCLIFPPPSHSREAVMEGGR